MLILTRKRDDSIRIGDDIVVRVMRTARGSVKIGIEAPETVRIVRGELFDVGTCAMPHDEMESHEAADALLLQH